VQNEVKNIRKAIDSTRVSASGPQPEVIVADGGSSDATIKAAMQCPGVQVVQTDKGRGAQLNAGAKAATGNWLLFLHADCCLPPGYFQSLASATQPRKPGLLGRCWRHQQQPRWGCFETIQTGCESMRSVQWGIRWRTRLFGTPYGDQGLFCSRAAYQQVRFFDAEIGLAGQVGTRALCQHCISGSKRSCAKLCGVCVTTAMTW
jgi:glycosyltransferase involved in cell wall biosynthesis